MSLFFLFSRLVKGEVGGGREAKGVERMFDDGYIYLSLPFL